MSEDYVLKAERRERVGKGSARALRREGKIPAVIYGDKKDPMAIAIDYKETHLRVTSPGFLTTLATIDVDGEKIRVLPKDFEADPVKDFTMHVDFLRVSASTKVTVAIPVRFINEEQSPGLNPPIPAPTTEDDEAIEDAADDAVLPGVLNIVRHEIDLVVSVNSIPEEIVVDLAGLELGAAVHISEIALPGGAELPVNSTDFTVVTIATADTLKSMDEEDEVEETEVIEQNVDTVEGEESATEAVGTDRPDQD